MEKGDQQQQDKDEVMDTASTASSQAGEASEEGEEMEETMEQRTLSEEKIEKKKKKKEDDGDNSDNDINNGKKKKKKRKKGKKKESNRESTSGSEAYETDLGTGYQWWDPDLGPEPTFKVTNFLYYLYYDLQSNNYLETITLFIYLHKDTFQFKFPFLSINTKNKNKYKVMGVAEFTIPEWIEAVQRDGAVFREYAKLMGPKVFVAVRNLNYNVTIKPPFIAMPFESRWKKIWTWWARVLQFQGGVPINMLHRVTFNNPPQHTTSHTHTYTHPAI